MSGMPVDLPVGETHGRYGTVPSHSLLNLPEDRNILPPDHEPYFTIRKKNIGRIPTPPY
ncbi:hypothetical protein MAPG_11249 [Magnaporthiopsis poae ATCC 64411]|uniref:Uncharacterized protein n=1 Tax=Magnaporthiopsis poae (strain ATCC 64411 / 73-15) TaxID=644358 RepID=A0A0C4EES0_MAGP6|nr:hypothetical protein MAPG_11249 [Magnaporthiopsis poae ATCC 64411]